MLTTVAAILANPRYTGRQVWNRQRTDHDDIEPDGTLTRHHEVQRWNAAPQWVISHQIAHPPLVSEEQFVAAQAIHTAPIPADGAPRRYLLTGLVCCGVCGRIMDSHWVHGRPGYRCRHGHTSSRAKTSPQPKILHIREDHLLDRVQYDRVLHRHHPTLRSPDPEKAATYLRTNNMIIVCDRHTWTIEAETAIYPLDPPGSFLASKAGSSRRRAEAVDTRRVADMQNSVYPVGAALLHAVLPDALPQLVVPPVQQHAPDEPLQHQRLVGALPRRYVASREPGDPHGFLSIADNGLPVAPLRVRPSKVSPFHRWKGVIMQPDQPRRVRTEPVRVGDAEFFVELADGGGPETVSAGKLLSFDGVRDTVHAVAGELAQAWQQVKPAEATVEFGLSLTAKSGPLTGLIVAGDGSATFRITLVWKGGS